jgi:hypothetical protein
LAAVAHATCVVASTATTSEVIDEIGAAPSRAMPDGRGGAEGDADEVEDGVARSRRALGHDARRAMGGVLGD